MNVVAIANSQLPINCLSSERDYSMSVYFYSRGVFIDRNHSPLLICLITQTHDKCLHLTFRSTGDHARWQQLISDSRERWDNTINEHLLNQRKARANAKTW